MATIFQSANIAIGATATLTVAATTQTCELVNMSHLAVKVNSNIRGNLLTLQPFANKPLNVRPNEELTFTIVSAVVNANAQSNEYIEVDESPILYGGGVTPLALIPVYNLPITGTVDINSGSVNASITGPVSLAAGQSVNVGSITETVNTSGPITNSFVAANPLVFFGTSTLSVNALASGATVYHNASGPLGQYDEVVLYIYSANQIVKSYSIDLAAFYLHNEPGVAAAYDCQTYGASQAAFSVGGYDTASGNYALVTNALPVPPSIASLIQLLVKNTTSGTITDTLTIDIWVRQSSQNVVNSTSTPVNVQGVHGSPTNAYDVTMTGQATTTLIPSGGVIKKLYIVVQSGQTLPSDTNLWFYNSGTQVIGGAFVGNIATGTRILGMWEWDFGEGIANNGITCNFATGSQISGTSGYASAYAVMQ